MAPRDETRLIARVARLYYESGLKQSAIAERLHLSQAKVSRLLKQALESDIVRITVRVPLGVHADLEEAIEGLYGLTEAIVVVTTTADETVLMRDLGEAAAQLVETTLGSGEVVGISSWSASLLAMVNAMHPITTASDVTVVQILGGVGSPAAEVYATELTRTLTQLLRGTPVLLPVPGIVGSPAARRVLEQDEHVRQALAWFPRITVALVGIGSLEPSPLLARSGNVFTREELGEVAAAGGVGDVCLRFFDMNGQPTPSALDDRVIGLSLDQLRQVPRRIAVAGGARKIDAIRGALRGGLITHLVIDEATARELVASTQEGTA